MEPKDKAIEAFVKSGVIGKILFTFLIVFMLFVAAFVWENIETSRMLSAIENMLDEQGKIESLKRCVKENYDNAEQEWRETKLIIGSVLNSNGVKFPNELNSAFQKYDVRREQIKDCLIFPQEAD